ncbi:MAG: hypothetical protein Q9165_006069 [Trypethelium subeluteriae]
MNGLSEDIPGYPRLAHHFARMPEAASFRSFLDLGNLGLLHKQAKLMDLERLLREQLNADGHSTEQGRMRYANDWRFLHHAATEEVKPGSEQAGSSFEERRRQSQLVEEMMVALKEYYELFLLTIKMTATCPPRKSDLNYHQWWLQQPSKGNCGLTGPDGEVWGSLDAPDTHAADLVCVKPRQDDDLFTEWVKSKFIFWFDKHIGQRLERLRGTCGEFGYREATLRNCADIFVMTLEALLLISSFAILYWIRSMTMRLILIAIFCVLFIICMTCVTKAKRSEIFSAVSAFAAVELVFIANNSSSKSSANVAMCQA